MAAPRRPPSPQELLDSLFDLPEMATVYLSPVRPELRTRVWLEFVGFPRHLWSQPNAAACVAAFRGVARLDGAELRRSGRMVAEAQVTRVAEVPKRVNVMESVRAPGANVLTGFRLHNVRLVVLSAEPLHEEEDGKGKMKKQRTASSSGFATKHGDGEVGTEERPESVGCFL